MLAVPPCNFTVHKYSSQDPVGLQQVAALEKKLFAKADSWRGAQLKAVCAVHNTK